MNAHEFKKAIGRCLLEFGFTKESRAYYKRSDDVICVVGLQKSSFSESYYINVGFVIRGIHPGLVSPRYFEADIGARFTVVDGNKRTDLFVPDGISSEDTLRQIIRENTLELTGGAPSMDGLRALLARRPTMLYQTTVAAKAALGLDNAT